MDLARFTGSLLGLALGDAVGTALEFASRGSFEPITDLVGGGPFDLAPGQWTDDTSMALCLATSLAERDGFDARDLMNRFVNWWHHGHLSSTGACFDIGNTTRRALDRYLAEGDPFAADGSASAAGNGSIMRLAPVALFYFHNADAAEQYAGESSRTTHAAREAIDACRLLARMLCRALEGASKREVLFGSAPAFRGARAIEAIARGEYAAKSEREIVGSGYVVESLEAALWCFAQTESYKAAVLRAANLGDKADTTAAVCGQLAGAFYAEEGIPAHWLSPLAMRDETAELARRLARARRA